MIDPIVARSFPGLAPHRPGSEVVRHALERLAFFETGAPADVVRADDRETRERLWASPITGGGNWATRRQTWAATFNAMKVGGVVFWFDPITLTAAGLPRYVTTTTASIAAGSDFSSASWTKGAIASVTANDDGIADRITTTSGTGTANYVDQLLTNPGLNSTACPPIFVTGKVHPGTTTWLMIDHATLTTRTIWVNVSAGTIGTKAAQLTNAAISAADGSGYRTITYQIDATNGTAGITIRGTSADNTTGNPGNGTWYRLKEWAVSQPRVASFTNRPSLVSWAQATADAQPQWLASSTLNGVPAMKGLRSTGAQRIDSTEAAVLAVFSGTNTPWTFISAVKSHHTTAMSAGLFSAFSSSTSNMTAVLQDNGGIGPWRVDRSGSALDAKQSTTYGVAASSGGGVVEVTFDASLITLRINGGAPNPNAAPNAVGALSPTQCRMLSYGGSSASGDYTVADMVILSRSADATTRSYLRRGLGMRAKITGVAA